MVLPVLEGHVVVCVCVFTRAICLDIAHLLLQWSVVGGQLQRTGTRLKDFISFILYFISIEHLLCSR